jgi:hypothetical protein
MNINQWLPLDPKTLDNLQEETKKGVHVEVSLSPYDIPEALRGYYSEDKKKFIIELKYISDETLVEKKVSDHMQLLEGKNSQRLYGFRIDAQGLDLSAISSVIKNELDPIKIRNIASDESRKEINEKLVRLMIQAFAL